MFVAYPFVEIAFGMPGLQTAILFGISNIVSGTILYTMTMGRVTDICLLNFVLSSLVRL